MSQKTFIVPHDFTKVADIALEHAIATAKPLEAEVQLLHVVAKQNQIHEANIKLEEIVEKFKSHGISLIPNVRIGSIFEDIGDFAAEHEARLIFM
jgi:nucleotide-binding universal stress UspA family protein